MIAGCFAMSPAIWTRLFQLLTAGLMMQGTLSAGYEGNEEAVEHSMTKAFKGIGTFAFPLLFLVFGVVALKAEGKILGILIVLCSVGEV